MAEYIEREAAIEMIKNDLPEQARYYRQDAIECLECMPTADAVPKSEVERLNEVIEDMDKQRAYTINMLSESLEKAKADVAREIFEEIEKLVVSRKLKKGLFGDLLESDIAELKKKYTEVEL